MGERAFVGLGSNLGDREEQLCSAVEALRASAGVRVVALSRLYETAPVGPPGQGPYLNAVVELETTLAPEALLARLHAIEDAAGRVRGERWGPRVLDLDLLLQGDRVRSGSGLELPHPRLCERAFVLEPLAELAPRLRHPVDGRTLAELARRVRDPEAVVPFEGRHWPGGRGRSRDGGVERS